MKSLTTRVRTHFLALVFGLVMCCVTLTSAPVFAQGTMGAVPDPIASRELEGYADRLELSRQQRQALEPLHDQYKQDFAVLRDGDIEKFLTNTRGMGGGMTMLFDRQATIKAFKDLEDIHSKVKTIDNRLFDQMQGMLTEEQATRMPLVRQARERVRYRSGLSRLTAFMNPAAQVDLSEIMMDITLAPPQTEQVVPLLTQYETNLTSGARRLFDSTGTLMMEGLDKLQQAGINEQTMRDREQMGRAFQNLRPIMSEIQLKLAARAAELADLNRRSLRSIAALLTEEQARTLRDQFYQRAYPEIRTGGTVAKAFEIVLKFQDLSAEQQQTFALMRTDYFTNYDRLMEQAMDLIDENRKTQSMFDQDREARRAHDEKLRDVRERRNQLNETTNTSLKAALTPELVDRLDKRLAGGGDETAEDNEIAVVAVTGGAGGPGAISVTATRALPTDGAALATTDPFIPAPISRRNLETYATRLNVDAVQRDILNSLHVDYTEKFDAIEKEQIAAVRQAERSLWGMENGQVTPPTAAAVDSLYAKRQQAIASILALDQTFFDDLAVTLGEAASADTIQRLRQTRQRDIYSRAGSQGGGMFFGGPGGQGGRRTEFRGGPGGPGGGMMRAFGGGSNEAGIDLASIIDSLTLEPTEPAPFQSTVAEYERSSVAVFQKLFESTMRMQQARDRMMAQTTTVDRGGERQVRIGDEFRTLTENEGRALNEARRAATDLNKSTLSTLVSLLPAGQGQQLRRSYNEKAFPGVYRDSASAQPHISAALNLPDLTPQQRSQVQEISMEFSGQYDQLCEQLIALEASMPDFTAGPPQGGRDGGNWQQIQEQIRNREKIEFERTDLNNKTLARLRSTLSEQQVQQLGGLQPVDNG